MIQIVKKTTFFLLLLVALTSCAQNAKKTAAKLPATQNQALITFDTAWTTTVEKTKAEWKAILTPDEYTITREQGTEKPFSSPLYENHETGVFYCVSCQNPLFASNTKFNSGTGWPSFFQALSTKSVDVAKDDSHGMSRDEVTCKRCHAHLGHVFNDGPEPTGLRYCMDGVALTFQKDIIKNKLSKATFGAGCFWCEEAVFESIKGVKEVYSGYAGGTKKNPTYEEVCSGKTGHAESFEVYYDSTQVSYQSLLRVFFASQDPTQVDAQGPDKGNQYRSILFYRSESEKKQATEYIANLTKTGGYTKPIATQVVPFTVFWTAEAYHQNYVANHPENPYVQGESIPRMKRTLAQVKDLIK